MKPLLSACFYLIFCSFANAAVPVEERGISHTQNTAQPIQPQQPSAALGSTTVPVVATQPTPVAETDTYGSLQMLRQEVMELRGIVEELSYQVKQLSQRQSDDYLDLDRRIAGVLSASVTAQPVVAPQPVTTAITSPDPGASVAQANEVQQYSAAYSLLKKGDVVAAKTALQQHTQNFPEGDYTPNAYYWLGEIYLLQNELDKAIQSFDIVVSRYPAHRKAADARFKLGTAYHLSGDHAKAQKMLNQAASGVGSSANLATKYLKDNY